MSILRQSVRQYSSSCESIHARRGLVLGAYGGCAPNDLKLTNAADKFDMESSGKFRELIKGVDLRLGKYRVFNNLGDYYGVAVVGTGPTGMGYNDNENINECKENIRVAAAVGAKELQHLGCTTIMVEGFSNAEAAAEGSALGVWKFEEFKNSLDQTTKSKVEYHQGPDKSGWERGVCKAEAQNAARWLSDMPGNRMTPADFARHAINILCPCGIHVDVRDRDWMETKNMRGFLGVAKGGACESPLLLEMSYCGGNQDEKPVILIGKGVTFDSGGICLQHCTQHSLEGRADMAGAAAVVGVMKACAALNIPINCNGFAPLSENMPGGGVVKPGDVVISLSGKSVRVEDTSKEGRVALADILSHTAQFKPCLVGCIGTLTDGVRCCLGSSSTGVFTDSNIVWSEMNKAGSDTGDRVWRLPLWKFFSDRVTGNPTVDVNNVTSGRGGESCIAASFLKEFAPQTDFLHMDITGTGMLSSGYTPYLRKGTMTGRPVRTVAQFLFQLGCPKDKPEPC